MTAGNGDARNENKSLDGGRLGDWTNRAWEMTARVEVIHPLRRLASCLFLLHILFGPWNLSISHLNDLPQVARLVALVSKHT